MVELKQSLSGRYVIERPLGAGGMAQVFEGTDSVLGRTVAVKVLSDRYARDGSSVARFRREARAAAGLNHPGVVSVFDTGSDDSVHYIVMERVEGRTLADLLAERGRLPAGQAAEIAAAAAEALAFAHQGDVVHRDVKPGNIMITDDGTVKVMDFGIARAITADTVTQTATVFGTAAYLSPEQARGERVDHRSDIYSLGVVLYEMLTGRTPFSAESPLAVAYKHVNEDPAPPTELAPDVPSSLEAVALRAMAKDPAARYQSAAQMASDLRRAVGTGLADTEPWGPGEEATASTVVPPAAPATEPLTPGPARRRGPWPWVLAFATVIVVALLVWALLAQGGPASGPAGQASRRGDAPKTSAPAPSSPAPTGTPTPSPTSVQEAVAQFQALLASGVASGQIDGHAADDLQHRVDEAVREYQDKGDLEKALEKLADADDRVSEFAGSGGITSGQFADSLHQAIADIGQQMQATPPPSGDEGHGGGDQGKGDGGGSEGG